MGSTKWIDQLIAQGTAERRTRDLDRVIEAERNGRLAARLELFATELSRALGEAIGHFNRGMQTARPSFRRIYSNAAPFSLTANADDPQITLQVTVSIEGHFVEARMTVERRRVSSSTWNLCLEDEEVVAVLRGDEDEVAIGPGVLAEDILTPFFAALSR